MNIIGFIWLEEIIEKLWQKHGVDIDEVEEVFVNSPTYRRVETGHRKGENVYAALGRTDSGRYLIVFFVYKRNRHALPISAREMTARERRYHGRSEE